jgi:hypothetical protein
VYSKILPKSVLSSYVNIGKLLSSETVVHFGKGDAIDWMLNAPQRPEYIKG